MFLVLNIEILVLRLLVSKSLEDKITFFPFISFDLEDYNYIVYDYFKNVFTAFQSEPHHL